MFLRSDKKRYAPVYMNKKRKVVSYLEYMKLQLGRKCLIVTEEILSGETVKKLAAILKFLGIQADIATFGVAWEPDSPGKEPKQTTTPEGFDIFIGSYRWAPSIDQEYTGLWDRGKSGKGHAIKRPPHGELRGRFSRFQPEKINASRVNAKELGHQLAQEFLSSKE